MGGREEHLKRWRTDGYALVEDFLSPEELASAVRELQTTFPTWHEYAAAPQRYRNDPVGGHLRELPFLGRTLNFIALNPDLIAFAQELLGTEQIVLLQAIVWAKYGSMDDFDQPMHVDYPTYSILYPKTQGGPEQVSFIIYYVDVDETLGPTYVVSRKHTQETSLVPYLRPKHAYPELYQHEHPMPARAGSMLAYDIATFHRGSRISAPFGVRFTHHIVFGSSSAFGRGSQVWAGSGPSAEMQALIEQASPQQRQVLGFPGPGDPYWDAQTVAGIAARYPNANLQPYRGSATGSSVSESANESPALISGAAPPALLGAGTKRRRAPVQMRRHEPVMVNLGSDAEQLPGFTNVDIVAVAGAQTADLQKRWPWEDNSVDYVHASHVIEHLPDPVFTINELWRILRGGAVTTIVVTTTDGPTYWKRPTHVSFWSYWSFAFCEAGSYWRNTLGAEHGIRAKFRTLVARTTATPRGPELTILLQAVKP